MSTLRYAHFLIDTHVPHGLSDVDILAARIRLLVSNTLSALRVSVSENKEVTPIKWSFKLFDSRIGHQIGQKQTALPTVSPLSEESLSELSTALTQELARSAPSSLQKSASSSSKTASATLKKLSDLTNRSKRRPTPKSDVATSQHTSFFENIALAVSMAYLDVFQSASHLDDHEGDAGKTSKNSLDSRSNRRSRKHECLVFVVSPYPTTLHDLMRSIERPEDQLQSLSKPPLDKAAALLYSKVKLKPILDSISKPAQQVKRGDIACQTVWLDTKSWNSVHPSQLASSEVEQFNSYFGSWHRTSLAESSSAMEISSKQTLEWAFEVGLAVASSCALSSLYLAHWPSQPLKQALNLLSSGWTSNQQLQLRIENQIIDIVLEPLSLSADSSVGDFGMKLEVSCQISSTEVLDASWTKSWLVTSNKWNSLLDQLMDSSKALLLSSGSNRAIESNSTRYFLLVPASDEIAHLLEIDWTRTLQTYLASETSESPPLPSLSQAPSTFLKRADSRLLASLPRQSSIEVMTQLMSATHYLEDAEASKDAVSLENRPALVFADEPEAMHLNASQSSQFSSGALGDDFRVSGRFNEPQAALNPETPELLVSALTLYLTDVYALFMHSISIFEHPHLLLGHSPETLNITKLLPGTDFAWTPQHLYLASNDQRSLEPSLFRCLDALYASCAHLPSSSAILTSVLTSKFIVPEASLRAKYLGDAIELPSEVTACDSQLDHSSLLTAEKKLIEHRIQVVLRLASWFYSTSSRIQTQHTQKKLEVETSTRKELFSLLESIAFLYSSKAELESFRDYFEGISTRMGRWNAPHTANWLKKRLGIDDSLEASNNIPSAETPTTEVEISLNNGPNFLNSLLESTVIVQPNEVSEGRKSPASAFALLIGSAPKSQLAITQVTEEDDLEPRKRVSKRSAEDELSPLTQTKRPVNTL